MNGRWAKSCSLLCFVVGGCAGTLDDVYFEADEERVGERTGQRSDTLAGEGTGATPDASSWEDAGQAQLGASDGGARVEPGDGWDAGQVDAGGGSWDAEVGGAGPDASKPQLEADAGGTTPSCDFPALMAQRCGNSGCHGAFGSAAGLDLVSADLAQRLSNVRGSGACGDYQMINVSAPEQSLLYLKVTAQACGIRMPIGGTLSDVEQQCILDWITEL